MKIIPIIICSFILMSCTGTTKSLWKNPIYKEKISTFLITDDGKKLAVIGSKYHYIFQLETNLKNILLSKNKKLLKAHFGLFKVNKNNNISGRYTIKYTGKNEKHINWLEKMGFESKIYRNRTTSTYSGSINGQRYTANKKINTINKFNKPYTIRVEEPSSLVSNIGKTLATPIAVAADGAKTIAGVILLPFALYFYDR